jgi:transposase
MRFNLLFTDEIIKQLRFERYHHPHPLVQRKMESLLLKSQGLSHKQIGKIVGVSQLTLRSYFEQYQQGGIEELKKLNFYRPTSELEQHKGTIKEEFTNHPPATLKEAAAKIKEITGIERSTVQVGKFLKKTDLPGVKRHPFPQKPTQKNKRFLWIKN